MKKSPDAVIWHDVRTGKPLGRFGQLMGKIGLVGAFGIGERVTPQMRAQRARYAATEALQLQRDGAHDRARIASSALYAGMNVLGRTADVPAHYRPGARTDQMPSPARAGVVESSLPFGSSVDVPRRSRPTLVDGVLGRQPIPELPVHITPEEAAGHFKWWGPDSQPAAPINLAETPHTPAAVPTPENASPVNWLGGPESQTGSHRQ